jgi:hypothetical protein
LEECMPIGGDYFSWEEFLKPIIIVTAAFYVPLRHFTRAPLSCPFVDLTFAVSARVTEVLVRSWNILFSITCQILFVKVFWLWSEELCDVRANVPRSLNGGGATVTHQALLCTPESTTDTH